MEKFASAVAWGNVYKLECYDKNGVLKWVEEARNAVVNEGLNHVLNTEFKSGSQIDTWYAGLIDNAGFTAISSGDSAGEIGGTNAWSELTEYDEASRVVVAFGSVSAQILSNSANKATFTANASKTVKGAFVVSSNTKIDTTGTLFGAAAFGSTRDVVDDDQLLLTVTLVATS